MKVYTFFTPSHKELLDIFIENFPYSDNTELNIKFIPQECSSGSFMNDGWNLTMKRKVQYVIQSLHETTDGEWFVHADCDIILFEGWDSILEKFKNSVDMMIQNDHVCLCAGFFFCKKTEGTVRLWNSVLEKLHLFENDQVAMNYFISQYKDVKIGVLPDTYFTYGFFDETWDGNKEFTIPDAKNLKIFHANWTKGTENKIKLLKEAKKQKFLDLLPEKM